MAFSLSDIFDAIWFWLSSNWIRTIAIIVFIPITIMLHEDVLRATCLYHGGQIQNPKFTTFDCVGIEDATMHLSYIQTISSVDISKLYIMAAYFLVIIHSIYTEITWRNMINEIKNGTGQGMVKRSAQGSKPFDIFRLGSTELKDSQEQFD